MAEAPPSAQETRSLAETSDTGSGTAHLLIIAGDSARSVPLPATGSLIAGRAAEADIQIDDNAISRFHARFTVQGSVVLVSDQGSHNGTLVNGVRLAAEQRLIAGDTVVLGETTIVFQAVPGAAAAGRLLSAPELLERLAQEGDRAVRFERPLTVVAIAAEPTEIVRVFRGLGGSLRASDVAGQLEEGLLVLLLPEQEPEEVTPLINSLVSVVPSARAGVAGCPDDGVDGATLLAAARAGSSGSARINPAAAVACRLDIGQRSVVVADTAMERIYELLRRLARSELAVLVCGETGVGKENAAFAVHAWSPRAQRRFVTLNCAAIQDSMVESELFGYRKGAFTGAVSDKVGLLEAAQGGTVFLDEVGELTAAAQAKLLRALESKCITRVGEVEPREVDFRIVAATNRELEREVQEGRFRQDLYFRLSTALVVLPPLRERRREIAVLARTFLPKSMRLSHAVLRLLGEYRWPGNVRELRNAMEFAAAAASGEVVEPWHLPERLREPDIELDDATTPDAAGFRPVAEELQQLELRRMREALEAAGGVQAQAARLIGMPRRTFTLKLRKYGLR